jgi:hypothetical protein
MLLVIESQNPEVINALSEVAKVLKVSFRVESDDLIVSKEERERRVNLLQKFKGGLSGFNLGYQPTKHDWYQQ